MTKLAMQRPFAGAPRQLRLLDEAASRPGQILPPGLMLREGAAGLKAAAAPAWFSLFELRLSTAKLTQEGLARRGFWLAQVQEGEGALLTEIGGTVALRPGSLVYGRVSRRMALSCAGGLHLRGAIFGRQASIARLATLPFAQAPMMLNQDGMGARMLSGVLCMAMAQLPDLTVDAMRPLELSLLEFLAAELAAGAAMARVLGGSMAKNAIALRAMQAIELNLPEPDLTPPKIAAEIGISLRYLQKIFEEIGESPNHYIRRRRLNRVWQDLQDPLYAGQSIAEISLRWGFADAAYFSRSFKEFYGISPSRHRAGGAAAPVNLRLVSSNGTRRAGPF